MSQKEDEILNREFVRVVTFGGLIGNLMSGGTGIGAMIGAILQIPLSKGLSKMLPSVISESVLEIHAAPAAVLKAAVAILEHAGRIVAESPPDNAAITAIVMSGFLKANPVLIQLKIQHRYLDPGRHSWNGQKSTD